MVKARDPRVGQANRMESFLEKGEIMPLPRRGNSDCASAVGCWSLPSAVMISLNCAMKNPKPKLARSDET